jgi:C1A family cysteine protease
LRKPQWIIVLVILLVGSLGVVGLALVKHDGSAIAAQRMEANPSKFPPGLQQIPRNPAFTQYLQAKAAGKVVTRTPDGRGLGYVPPPTRLSRGISPIRTQALAFPVTYDLRTLSKVSPVYNQGACGSCWSFASLESMQSYLRPGYTGRLSENNLKDLHDFYNSCCEGGNATMSTAYFARWGTTALDDYNNTIYSGPVANFCDPYSATSCTSPTACAPVKHVQTVVFLPLKQSLTDNYAIKNAVMKYGAVYTAFQWQGYSNVKTPYWNPATYSYYDKYRAGGNHAVTIIGWNDTFAKTNFSTVPPGNGAWIVRNSWGTGWGDAGDFYVSYYDINMGHVENAAFTAQWVGNYKKNYMYDYFGMGSSVGWVTDSVGYGANIFTASAAGTLKAISFWTPIAGTQFTAKVYVNPTAGKPASGTLKSTISGSVAQAGYYTKLLTTTVAITNGQKFSVVIKFTTPGDGYPVPLQTWIPYFNDAVPSTPTGVSFISHDGITWYDLSNSGSYGYGTAVNIHAFAN